MVPLMEEEMSFLAKLIVQKRAEPLFGEALLLSQCTYMQHAHTQTCVQADTRGLSDETLECEAQEGCTEAHMYEDT